MAMIDPVKIRIPLPTVDTCNKVRAKAQSLEIPVGGLVFSSIAYGVSHPEETVQRLGEDFESYLEVILTKNTLSMISAAHQERFISKWLVHMLDKDPQVIKEWYMYSFPGSGSGKISKTK
jgi:hypothetical protein